MRNMYKFSAVLFIALSVISAQGVEAQRATPKTNQNNPHYNSGKNDRYDRGDNPRGNDQRYGSKYGHGNQNSNRFEGRFDRGGHGYGHSGFDRNVNHHFYGGQFYKFHRGNWARMNAPIGMHVGFMPYGTQVIYTRHGVIYRYGSIYFQRARRGGFIVVNGPRNRRGW
jgi:hypothetical protein